MNDVTIDVDLASTVSDDEHTDALYNDHVELTNPTDQPDEASPAVPATDLDNVAKIFHPILVFLWSVLKKSDTITGSRIIICNKQQTLS